MKRIFLSTAFLLSIFVGLIAVLPQIASTRLGKHLFLRTISSRTGTNLSMETVALSWFGPQKCTQLISRHPNFELKADDFTYHIPLWKISEATKQASMCKLSADLEVQNASIEFYFPGQTETLFEHLYAKIAQKNNEYHLDIDFYVRSKTKANIGKCFLHGTVSSLSFEDLDAKWEDFSCDLQVNVKRLPSHFLDLFFDINKLFFTSFCGNYLSLEGNLFLDHGLGEMQCAIAASNVQANIDGYWENKAFFLRSPLYMQFFIEEDMSKHFLRKIHPCFASIASCRVPVKLSIEKQGFCCPLDYTKLSLEKGVCEMGKLECNNQGMLSAILNIMKEESLFGLPKMDVWFTPMEFTVRNGVIHTRRMDLLIGDCLHLFTWGDVDYLHNKLSFTLGVSASTIKRSFGLSLREDLALLIPIDGTVDNPKIDSSEISALLAQLAVKTKTRHTCKNPLPHSPLLPWQTEHEHF